MKMRKSTNKAVEIPQVAGRRSLRHSRPLVTKKRGSSTVPKGRKSVGRKKAQPQAESKKKETKKVESDDDNKTKTEEDAEKESEKGDSDAEETITPTTSKNQRVGRKRQADDGADTEEEEKKDTLDTEQKENTKGTGENGSDLNNGEAETTEKSKGKKKRRRPPVKKKKEETQDESDLWTPLEPLVEADKQPKKLQSKSDRRKQALVEREAAAEVMLQKQLPRRRNNSAGSECEVLDCAPRLLGTAIETVDIDDDQSEAGSIQIVAVPDGDSVFDFKRLLIQYRSVHLPSTLWGVHRDPRGLFVSFTRFNPDYPNNNGLMVDRAVVFMGSLNPEVYINNEKMELPEMFTVVQTLVETSQVIQLANNTVAATSSVEAVTDQS